MENNEIEDFFNNPAGFMRHSMNHEKPESEFMQEYQQVKVEPSTVNHSLLHSIATQAAKVRKLQKDYFESVKKGNKDYEILQQSKIAEKELDVLLEEYNSPQERLI